MDLKDLKNHPRLAESLYEEIQYPDYVIPVPIKSKFLIRRASSELKLDGDGDRIVIQQFCPQSSVDDVMEDLYPRRTDGWRLRQDFFAVNTDSDAELMAFLKQYGMWNGRE